MLRPLGATRILPESLPPMIRMVLLVAGQSRWFGRSSKQSRISKRLSLSLNEQPEIVKRHGDDKNVAAYHVHDGVIRRITHVRRGKHNMRGVDDNLSFPPRFSGNVDVA